ncbi:MAG: hypothetical protein Q8R78_01415 [Candidatus Omnitrophota bacterium]|nr:hypothetical protein [Candidatus Omnitrophota bacterium]
MPDTGFLFLSLASVLLGILLVLFPQAVVKLSSVLNRTLAAVDDVFLRYRYLVAVLAFVASYAFFHIALTLPAFRG